MYDRIYTFLNETGLDRIAAAFLSYLAALAATAVVTAVVWLLVRGIVVKVMGRVVKRTRSRWDDICFDRRVFHRAAGLVIPVTLSMFAPGLPQYGGLLAKAAGIAGVAVFLLLLMALADAANEIYKLYEISKVRPIHSLLQVVQVGMCIIGGIVAVAILTDQNPFALLGGIGAMTAVTSFIFKDAILGFVAGIQLTANDLIRIGDWIQVPKQSADGTVVDLSMTTVKVENFDKTITSIPAYTLVSDAFINWRGMESSGGRRIKRAIYIDAAGVRLCDDEMLGRFRGMALLEDYIDEKLAEIDRYNRGLAVDGGDSINARRLTNIGTFRIYILRYLRQHPGIHKDMTAMVRQLAPDDRGIPLEIYAFTGTTAWAEYEDIQSDIFDHLYSVVSAFGLQVYQRPSGEDIRRLGGGR